MPKVIQIGTTGYTEVIAVDSPEFGAHHHYAVKSAVKDDNGLTDRLLSEIHFQKGPIKEHGVNGVCNEDLLAIIIDRLEGFQTTDFKCRENALAITKLEEALHWLRHRTGARERRGVEGTNQI